MPILPNVACNRLFLEENSKVNPESPMGQKPVTGHREQQVNLNKKHARCPAFLAYPLLLPASFRGSSLSGRAIAQTVSTTARRSARCERADRVRAIPNTSVEGRVLGGEVRVREALVLLVVFLAHVVVVLCFQRFCDAGIQEVGEL